MDAVIAPGGRWLDLAARQRAAAHLNNAHGYKLDTQHPPGVAALRAITLAARCTHPEGVPADASEPDWTVAPAATIREWMREHEIADAGQLAAMLHATVPSYLAAQAGIDVEAVLNREPMPRRLAGALAALTGASLAFWLNLEANYRDALERDLADVTGDD